MARTVPALALTSDQRDEIGIWLKKKSLEHAVARRCRAILLAADGVANVAIGEKVGLHRNSVELLRDKTGLSLQDH